LSLYRPVEPTQEKSDPPRLRRPSAAAPRAPDDLRRRAGAVRARDDERRDAAALPAGALLAGALEDNARETP
jgi:hypothetical protein